MHYVVALLILIAGYLVWVKLIRRRAPVGQDWERIADELGFTYFAGTSRQYPIMRGSYRDLDVRISSEKAESTRGRTSVTRVVAFFDFPTPEGLFVARHGKLGALERIFMIEHIEIGEPEVDDKLLIKATREDEVLQLFADVPLRKALLELFDTYPTAQVSTSTMSVTLSGVARDARQLNTVLRDLESSIDFLETALACEETERISEGRRSSTPPPMPEIQFTAAALPTIFENDLGLKGATPPPKEEDDDETPSVEMHLNPDTAAEEKDDDEGGEPDEEADEKPDS